MSVKSVLVLDDCEDLLEVSKFFIEDVCNCRAITASSLAAIKEHGVNAIGCDLALLDINLGPHEPNGLDVYHWLRANGFKGAIYFLTGHARTFPLVAEAERLGDAKILTKPLLPEHMSKIIRGEV